MALSKKLTLHLALRGSSHLGSFCTLAYSASRNQGHIDTEGQWYNASTLDVSLKSFRQPIRRELGHQRYAPSPSEQ